MLVFPPRRRPRRRSPVLMLPVASPAMFVFCAAPAMFVFSCIGPHAALAFDMLMLRRRPLRRRRDLRRFVPPMFVLPAAILSFCIVVLELLFCPVMIDSAPTRAKVTTSINRRVIKLSILLLMLVVTLALV